MLITISRARREQERNLAIETLERYRLVCCCLLILTRSLQGVLSSALASCSRSVFEGLCILLPPPTLP